MFTRSAMLGVTDDVMPVSFPPLSQTDSSGDEEGVILRQWLNKADSLKLTDYAPANDILVLAYDAARHPNPIISLESMGADTRILLDGYELAIVNGKLDHNDLQLLPI